MVHTHHWWEWKSCLQRKSVRSYTKRVWKSTKVKYWYFQCTHEKRDTSRFKRDSSRFSQDSRETRRISREGGNLLLSSTVSPMSLRSCNKFPTLNEYGDLSTGICDCSDLDFWAWSGATFSWHLPWYRSNGTWIWLKKGSPFCQLKSLLWKEIT